jgi:uncharacterized protein YcbX
MSHPERVAPGSVVCLWRYPVKSMMGEELNAAEITERGLLGDRAYALVDRSDGKVASAKNPGSGRGCLTSAATVDRLRELYPPGSFEVRRFRPNIVVETTSGVKDFVENAWIGRTLAIGDAVRLSVTCPCPAA